MWTYPEGGGRWASVPYEAPVPGEYGGWAATRIAAHVRRDISLVARTGPAPVGPRRRGADGRWAAGLGARWAGLKIPLHT